MEICLWQAIKDTKKGENWVLKYIIGSSIWLLIPFVFGFIIGFMRISDNSPIAIISNIIYFLIGLYIQGYFFQTGNILINEDEYRIPSWTEKDLFIKGIKGFFARLCFSIILSTICAIIFFAVILLLFIIGGSILWFLSHLIYIDAKIYAAIAIFAFCVIAIVIFLFYLQFALTAYMCFAKSLKFTDYVDLERQFKIVKENQHTIWTLIGKNILLSLIAILCVFVLAVTIIGIFAIPFVIFAINIVAINLISRFAKTIDINKYFTEED